MEKNVFLILLLLVILLLNVITSLFYENLFTTGGWVVAFLVSSKSLITQININKLNFHINRINKLLNKSVDIVKIIEDDEKSQA